ncbi:isocitrate lyase/PEP mutase family protein [Pelagicoccus mobilis]|uniref:Isocitrate lyase/phosphoenolpyruvate mutase family protein n=1 Tax=Pelagicoccus mobilis TaxID=415221 RepID=A0A934S5J0_9BACT|nr:isocitrate lyase/phosphoenolpyruvate mutase family protein [Pelagicoccus mobilis]MBK1880152.1 isocitrate lyase/phosphoenolpyruvate mutase family protein [Pelagicoccus mobilis]
MPAPTQPQKADTLHALHHNGELLKLPNIWNPIGARILEAKGHPAVATASAAISAALGYADGELISRNTLVEQVSRIANSVDVPVTADIETGFGESTDELAETIRLITEAGAVGINLEDSIDENHTLRSIDEQCERIATARATANLAGINLYINARIDAFFCRQFATTKDALAEISIRSQAYLQAGASGIYPIGNSTLDVAKQIRDLTEAPINLLALPHAAKPSELAKIGINRLSYGPFVFRTCLQKLHETIDAIDESDNYDSISSGFSTEHVGPYLKLESEEA